MNLAELNKNIKLYNFRTVYIAIAVVYLFSLMFPQIFSSNSSDKVYSISIFFFTVFNTFWGTFIVANSQISEIRNKTWIYQKMSALEAKDMLVGKLIGPVVYNWAFGLIILTIALLAALLSGYDVGTKLSGILKIILTTVMFHSLGLILSILFIKRKEDVSDLGNFNFTPILLIYMILMYFLIHSFISTNETFILWYDIPFNYSIFTLLSSICFTFWALLGAYRLIKEELNYELLPYAWICFNIFLLVYFSGFLFETELGEFIQYNVYFVKSYAVLITTVLITILLEPISIINYRFVLSAFKEKNYRKVALNLPLWLITLCFCMITAIILSLNLSLFKENIGSNFLIPIVVILFLAKDILVNIYLHINEVKKANLIWFFYMLIWYFFIPYVLLKGVPKSLYAFYPIDPLISTIMVLIYLAIIILMIYRKIKSIDFSNIKYLKINT
ncbi:MAG: hypothetical protein R2801_03690 [Chitinophagales bacterium]